MKKKLLPISLLCLLGMILAGCGGSKSSNTQAPSSSGEPSSVVPSSSSVTPAPSSSSVAPSSSSVAPSSSSSSTPSSSSAPSSSSSSVAPQPVAVTGVALDKTAANVILGQTLQLTATVSPENADNKAVTWSSSDPDVASVSNGLVTAEGIGEATITVKTRDGGKTATCVITVVKEIEKVEITNKAKFSEFIIDDMESINVSVTPADNVQALLAAGALKATSSDPTVASVVGLTVTALKVGTTTIKVELFGKSDSFELKVGDAIPGVAYTIANALAKGIEEAPFNGSSGKAAAITTTCFELQGLILAISPNGETGYNAILDDGTGAVYLQISKEAGEAIPLVVGDYAKVTCKLTNYYGLLEGVSRKAATGVSGSWVQAKDVIKLDAPETPIVPTLNEPEAMTGEQYNAYFDICKVNGTKNAEGATFTNMKYVTIDAEYLQDYVDADKGGYKISDKYGLAPYGYEMDTPFEGQKSTLKAFLIGANTGKGKSNAIVMDQIPLAPTAVALDQEPQIIVHGNTLQMTYTTTPAGSYSRKVAWTSSDETAATIDEKGLLLGVYEGSGSKPTNVKVTLGEGDTAISSAEVAINVFGETVHATAVALAATASVYVGEKVQLTATPTPEMVSDKAVWSSDNEEIATVDGKGLVSGLKSGTANITVKYNDNVSATCAVTVSIEPGTEENNPLAVAAAIEIGKELAHNTQTEKTYYVKGIVSKIVSNDLATDYANATFWLANGETVAEGFEAYRVKLAEGVTGENLKVGAEVVLKCNIKRYSSTIETNTGALIQSITYADRPITSLTLDNDALALAVGEDATLKATIAPVYATQSVTWSSSDEAVATVENGKVTAVAAGTATITVAASDTMKAECVVTVSGGGEVPQGPITVSKTVAELKEENGWANSGVVNSVKIGKVNFTFTGDSGDTKYYDSGSNLRIYIKAKAEGVDGAGSIALAADEGYTIKSVTFTYVWNKSTGTFPLESGVAGEVNDTSKTYAITNPGSANEQMRITAISVTYEAIGAAQQEVAQPSNTFSGLVNVGGQGVFTTIALANQKAFVEIGSDKVTVDYTFDKATGLVTIPVGGNYGNLTGTYDPENGKLTNCGIDGAASAAVTGNGSLEFTAALKHFDAEGTDAELQAIFKRRVGSAETGLVTADTTNFVAGQSGVQLPGNSSGDVRLNLKQDIEGGVTAKNLGFWVYNPSANNVKLRMWVYKAANLGSNAEIASSSGVEFAPGWSYYRIGFTEAKIYNIQIGDFAKSGVNLTFDNIAIF